MVFDATPLVYLATVDRLALLDHLDQACVIPGPVFEEVVTAGNEAGHPDARRVEQAVEAGVLDRRPAPDTGLQTRLGDNPNLADADVAVIALAAEAGGIAVMDERYGRAAAETEGVETRGTAWILSSLVRDGHVAADDGREIVDETIDAGWYCSTDLYSRTVRTLESLS